MGKTTVHVSDVPKMMRFWDHEKNTEDPALLSPRSKKTAFWKCPDCGYAWSSTIATRYAAKPLCPCHETGKRIQPKYNDYLTILPDAAREYDFAKNEANGIDIYHEGVSSETIVSWKCPDCGREWTTSLATRVKRDKITGKYSFSPCPHYNTTKRKQKDVSPVSDIPSLMKFWSSENTADPHTVPSNSSNKYIWKCGKCGYTWETSPRSRLRLPDRCPCCEQNKVIREGVNDFLTVMPELKKWFSYEDNKDIDYHNLGIRNQTVLLWWICPNCGFKFQSPIANRISRKKSSDTLTVCRCRHCGATYTPISSDSDLMKFWNPSLNIGISPDSIPLSSTTDLTWECPNCHYTWTKSPRYLRRQRIIACPHCELNEVIYPGHNDVLTLLPELSRYFDEEAPENAEIKLNTFGPGSATTVSWKCPNCGYKWSTSIRARVRNSNPKDTNLSLVGCPRCERVPYRKISYAEQYPDLLNTFDAEENGVSLSELLPSRTTSGKLHWICTECGNKYTAWFSSMVAVHTTPSKCCPYCNGRLVDEINSLATKYPEIEKMWSSENSITANSVSPDSKVDRKWLCPECQNTFTCSPYDMVHGHGCPYCEKRIVDPKRTSLAAKYPKIASHWSYKNDRGPETVFPTSQLRVLWQCDDCGLDYYSTVLAMVKGNADCPYCHDRLINPGFNSLKALHPDLMDEWIFTTNTLLGIDPDTISERSNKRAWWQCKHDPKHHLNNPG